METKEIDRKTFFAELYELDNPDTTTEDNDDSKTSGVKSSSTKRKRKRSLSLELLPDAQQIFQGLRFYFIPNDDVTPARKLRIRKAQERGAIWVKEWTEGISHVIADKRLTYDDIIKFLKLSSMPPLYHVPGQEQKLAPKEPPVLESVSVSEQSLPLKPGKRAHVQPSQTPPRTEPSEQGSAAQASVADTTTRPESRPLIQPALKPGNQPTDALDQAIAETLAVKDL
ncbi:MAG: hypothetical protein LQ352_004857, partial [Teloschistes flavicans]